MIHGTFHCPESQPGPESGKAVAFRAAGWLHLAAAPTFGLMALLTGLDGSAPAMVCPVVHDALPLGGMATMYILMSVFHIAPWLTLISRCRRRRRP